MTNQEIKEIYHRLETEVEYLTQSALIIHKEACKEDSRKVISLLKVQLDCWLKLLIEDKLSFIQLEFLIFQKKNQLEMENLKNKGVSQVEIDLFKHCLLRLVVNTVFNSMLEKYSLRMENNN